VLVSPTQTLLFVKFTRKDIELAKKDVEYKIVRAKSETEEYTRWQKWRAATWMVSRNMRVSKRMVCFQSKVIKRTRLSSREMAEWLGRR
jgi:hypothetical protein